MSNIWFPLPVALFLRRVVNVISTLSITHHYLFPFPPRSTGADTDNSVECLLSPSSPWAGRVHPYPNGQPREEADRHVLPWATIVENGLLDRILQGMTVLPKLLLEPRSDFFSLYIASRKLSMPGFHWPAQLSLFHPASESGSNDCAEQPNDSTKTEGGNFSPFSASESGSSPQEPPEPVHRTREERENVDMIHRLIQNPALYNPLRAPRYPIVLCHGAPHANHDFKESAQT